MPPLMFELPKLSGKIKPFPESRYLEWVEDLKVNTKDFGLIPFRMLGTQRYILEEIKKGLLEGCTTFVILKARQIGCSTFFLSLDMFWAMEHPGLCGVFATHTDQSKAQFRNTIKVFLRHLPKSKRVALDSENRDMVIFENSSMFLYLVAGTKEKTQSNMGRSAAMNYLHATEVAYWGSEDDKKELFALMSTHYPWRLAIIESTANGFNHFHEQWEAAKASPVQYTIFVGWWRDERYAYAQTHPYFHHYMPEGMASALTLLERKRKRDVLERYGIEVTHEQIAWYRWYLEDQCEGDQQKMDELFPWVEEDAFVATGARFFTNLSLTEQMRMARKQPFKPYTYALSQRWQDTQVLPVPQRSAARATLRIWEEPDPTGYYVIGADPSYGASDTADRNCAHVARGYADMLVQVAEFNSPECASYQFAWVLAHLAGWYGNCAINLEITGPGTSVWDEFLQLRNRVSDARLVPDENFSGDVRNLPLADARLRNCLAQMRIYLYRKPDSPGQIAYHWRTSPDTKRVLMNHFRSSFELNRHIVRSIPCLEEMKGVIQEGTFIGAEGRAKDDRPIAAALANIHWLHWLQPQLRAMGLTYDAVRRATESGAKPSPTVAAAQAMVMNYLRTAKILLPGETLERPEKE